eukprot:327386-Pyramimonas_sp.AAC.1
MLPPLRAPDTPRPSQPPPTPPRPPSPFLCPAAAEGAKVPLNLLAGSAGSRRCPGGCPGAG